MTSESQEFHGSSEWLLVDALEQYRNHPTSQWEIYSFYGINEGDIDAATERRQTKSAFLADQVRNPRLAYPALVREGFGKELEDAEQRLIDLKSTVDLQPGDSTRIEVASEIPGTRHLEIVVLQISKKLYEGSVPEADKSDYVELFNLINNEVHGTLEQDRFVGLLSPVQDQATNVLNDEHVPTSVLEVAQYIVDNTGDVSHLLARKPIKVSKRTISKLQQLIDEEYADLVACIPEKAEGETYSNDELLEIFKAMHQARETGWDAIILPGATSVDSNQATKTTRVGEDRKQSDYLGVRSVALHENGVHVERRKNGDVLADPLLQGMGLSKYLDAEEGIATVIEQILAGKQRASGEQYYRALGLAQGMDGHGRRDFRDVFEFEWRRLLLGKHTTGKLVDDSVVESVRSAAYGTCLRIFRGTPCDVPGMVYTKDQSYFMGNQKMWEVFNYIAELAEEKQRGQLGFLLAAKFDPTNPQHTEVVHQALGRRD